MIIPCSLGRDVEHSYNKKVFLRFESSGACVGRSMDGRVGRASTKIVHSPDALVERSLVCFVLTCQSARGTWGNYSTID